MVDIVTEGIAAYHHTSKAVVKSILEDGFDSKCFKKVSIGHGVQCFLDKLNYSPYEGKTDGQIKVKFENCRILNDDKKIEESQSKIQQAPSDKMLKVAKNEAEVIKKQGYDAYKGPPFSSQKQYIVFLNFPKVVEWIPF